MANKTLAELQSDLQLAARGSYDRNAMDVQDHVLYDNTLFAATTLRATTTFYNSPIGSPYGTGTKTQTETNMQLQGQIPNSQYFIANEVSIAAVLGIVGADVDQNVILQAFQNIVQNSNYKIILAGRSFDNEMPGSVFFPPVYANALNSAANGTSVGSHTSSGWVSLKLPVVIEGGAAFSVQMNSVSAIVALQTILNTASDALATQNAQIQFRMKGTLIRYK